MGVVYAARQHGLERVVALKFVLDGNHTSVEARARFRREATAVARLRHPNVVQIHEIGEHEGRPYYSMEYLAGGSLADRLGGKPQNPKSAAEFVETIARAVHAAHREGIIHRDLKPANILLEEVDSRQHPVASSQRRVTVKVGALSTVYSPKITDFGLAKVATDDGETLGTRANAIMGSPSYMPPEQAHGTSKEVDRRADVYSLGAILYEMLTGRPPFRAETTVETVVQVVHEEPVPPRRLQSKLPRDLETICLKCLEKAAKSRYATALELADDLERYRKGEPIHARPIVWWQRAVKWARRRPAAAALVGVIALALATVLAGAVWYNARLRNEVALTMVQQKRAAENLHTAIDVLEHQLNELRHGIERGQPAPREVVLGLMENAVPFYERLLLERDQGDSASRRAIGRAYWGLAQTQRMAGNVAAAEKSIDQAIAVQEKLLEESPDDVARRIDLAHSLRSLSLVYSRANQPQRVEEALKRMVALIESLSPDEPRLGDLAAFVAQKLGTTNQVREALPWLDRHVREIENAVKRSTPGVAQTFLHETLHSMYVTRAMIWADLKDDRQALANWDAVIALGDQPTSFLRLNACRAHRAAVLVRLGEYRLALQDFVDAMAEGATKSPTPPKKSA
jgi:tetratricopeptide (TPR) repeat protein